MTKITLILVSLVICACFMHETFAVSPQTIDWKQLVPVKVFEDPFEKLSDKQLEDLSHVVRVQMLLAKQKISPESEDVKAARVTHKSLIKQGVDVEFLMLQRDRVRQIRKQQAYAVVPSLDDKEIQLFGFMIPVRRVKEDLVEFLLVPTVDACSHGNPPPSNQMVFVQLRDGFANANSLQPVVVTGTMKAKKTSHKLLRGNGPIEVTAVYAISGATVKRYSEFKLSIANNREN